MLNNAWESLLSAYKQRISRLLGEVPMKPSMLRIYCLRAKRSEDENENAENKNIQVKRLLDSMVYGEKVAGLMGHTVATV